MSGTKENALIISNKATPVTPTISGDISVVARNGFLYTFDGIVEKQIGDTSAIENRLTVVEANDVVLENSINTIFSTYANSSTVASISAGLDSRIVELDSRPIPDIFKTEVASISAGLDSRIVELDSRPIPDIFKTEVASISAGLSSRIDSNSAIDAIQTNSINTLFSTYASSSTVQAISAGLDSRIVGINTRVNTLESRPIPDIFKTEVASISAGLNVRINANDANDAIQTNSINTLFSTYANSTTVASISAGLQSQINTKANTSQLSNYQLLSEKAQANGYASLDTGAKIPLSQLPDSILGQVEYIGTWNASTNSPTLTNPGTKGNYYVTSVSGTQFGLDFQVGDWVISDGSSWGKVDNTDAVSTVFGRIGNVVANSGDYNASQITNTPAGNISSNTVQAALNELDSEKLNSSSYTASDVLSKILTVDGTTSGLDADLLDGNHASAFVLTGDSRLSDARTPTSHASSHGSVGSDPITIAQSQVTNLTTDLSNKLNSSSYTASDVLTKIKTVDGTTSGLDADLLDGIHASGFALAGTSGLLYFTESINTTAPNNVWTSHVITPATTSTNADIVLETKGLGAIIRDIPDNTATGGNKRGQNAVDLQGVRDSADDVASGNNSVVIGGSNNSATNNGSVSIGGNNNTATGAYSAVIGSGSSQANATTSGIFCGSSNRSESSACVIAGGTANRIRTGVNDSFIGGGYGCEISGSGTYSAIVGSQYGSIEGMYSFAGGGVRPKVGGQMCAIVGGMNNTIWGAYGCIVGSFGSTVMGQYSAMVGGTYANIMHSHVLAHGESPTSTLDHSDVQGGVSIGTLGGYQKEETVMGISTTTATATAFRTNAGINYIPISPGECVMIHAVVSAFQNTTTNNGAGYIFECAAKNVGGTVTIIGQTVRAKYANNTAWNMTATVLAGQGVQINAVGAASVTIHWGGSFKIVRVRGA